MQNIHDHSIIGKRRHENGRILATLLLVVVCLERRDKSISPHSDVPTSSRNLRISVDSSSHKLYGALLQLTVGIASTCCIRHLIDPRSMRSVVMLRVRECARLLSASMCSSDRSFASRMRPSNGGGGGGIWEASVHSRHDGIISHQYRAVVVTVWRCRC